MWCGGEVATVNAIATSADQIAGSRSVDDDASAHKAILYYGSDFGSARRRWLQDATERATRNRLAADRSTSLRQPAISIAAVHERCLTSAPPRLSCTHLRFQYRHRPQDWSVRRSGSLWSWCFANGLLACGRVVVRCRLDRNRWRHRRAETSVYAQPCVVDLEWVEPGVGIRCRALCSACWAVGAARRCDTPERTPCLPG
jgi:hypothetical protein